MKANRNPPVMIEVTPHVAAMILADIEGEIEGIARAIRKGDFDGLVERFEHALAMARALKQYESAN